MLLSCRAMCFPAIWNQTEIKKPPASALWEPRLHKEIGLNKQREDGETGTAVLSPQLNEAEDSAGRDLVLRSEAERSGSHENTRKPIMRNLSPIKVPWGWQPPKWLLLVESPSKHHLQLWTPHSVSALHQLSRPYAPHGIKASCTPRHSPIQALGVQHKQIWAQVRQRQIGFSI